MSNANVPSLIAEGNGASLFEMVPVKPQDMAGSRVQSVDARRLHAALGSGKDFSTWIKAKLDRYGFIEGQDFAKEIGLSSPISGSSKARPQETVDYLLTLNTAKEIAMVEQTDRGRQVRRYFIECERLAHTALTTAGIDMKVIGGVVKSVVAKQIEDAIHRRLPELVAAAMQADPRRAVGEFVPMLDILKERGVVPKRRRALSQRASARARRFCVERNYPIRISPETGRYLFQVDGVRAWLEAEGRTLISDHNAKIAGQGVLKLVQPKSPTKPRSV